MRNKKKLRNRTIKIRAKRKNKKILECRIALITVGDILYIKRESAPNGKSYLLKVRVTDVIDDHFIIKLIDDQDYLLRYLTFKVLKKDIYLENDHLFISYINNV